MSLIETRSIASSAMLPVIVIEAISSDISTSSLSVKISNFGWAWLVCGRRLFVWKFKQSQSTRSTTACPCFELKLPPSDVAHKADLVCVFNTNEHLHQNPSTIAVSPEGIIRFWPNIAYEGVSIEATASDLQGQECMQLLDIQPLGCILGTTTSTLVHVTINNSDGQNSIVCRTLKAPQGVLAGLSKRVSSFIFGTMPASHSSETKQLIKMIADTSVHSNELEHFIWVLVGNCLQKWHIINSFSERLIDEIEIEKIVRDLFIDNVWSRDLVHLNQLQIWPIDTAILSTNEIVLLVAGVNAQVSNQLYYALVICKYDSSDLLMGLNIVVESFLALRNHTVCYSREDEEQLLNLHLLTVASNSKIVYIYNSNRMLRVLIGTEGFNVDAIDINNSDDGILGAGVCDDVPLLFTRKNAIISIVPYSSDVRDVITVGEIDDEFDEFDENDENLVGILKKSFILFLKQENARSQKLLTALLQLINDQTEHKLDDCVVEFSKELCNEKPSSDPRWAETESSKRNSTTSASAIIMNQLENKYKMHKLFIDFLKVYNLWERLTTIIVSGNTLSAHMLLCDHAEKLIATIKIKKIHEQNPEMFDEIIRISLRERNVVSSPLNEHDLFYRETTKVENFIFALICYQQERINESLSNQKLILQLIITTSQVLIEIFKEISNFRKSQGNLYESFQLIKCEYIPWSCTSGPRGIRTLLLKQFENLVTFGGQSMNVAAIIEDEIQIKGLITNGILELADIILDGFVCQLKSIDISMNSERYKIVERNYETIRSKCLKPLFKARQYDKATILAEKYQDFDILIRICDELDNQERLQRYMTEYNNKGFSKFLFNWYIKEGKQGKMLINTANSPLLGDFLKNHHQLNWLHQIHLGQFDEASQTLKHLGLKETENSQRKKTILSLSKLAALAGDRDNTNDVNDINEELRIINEKEKDFNSNGIETTKELRKTIQVTKSREIFVKDSQTGKDIPLDQAVNKGLISQEKAIALTRGEEAGLKTKKKVDVIITDSATGSQFPLNIAVSRGIIDEETAKRIQSGQNV